MASKRNIELNKQLTQAWYTEDILQIVRASLEEFNLVNCTTALNKLAKAAGKKKPRFGKLEQSLLARTVRLVKDSGAACPSQNLANALWACEKLGAKTAPETSELIAAARQAVSVPKRLAAFSGQHLANTVWAAAKLEGSKNFRPFADAVKARAADLNGQELSMAAWALGSTGDASSEAIQAVAEAARALPDGGVRTLAAQQLATLAWSLARLACRDAALFSSIALHAPARVSSGEFNAQDLANTAWAFGRLDVSAPALFATIGEATRRTLEAGSGAREPFTPQQLSMIAWAFAKLNVKDVPTLLAMVQEAENRLKEFSPRDLTDIVWSLAQLQIRTTTFLDAVGELATARLKDFNSQELMRFMAAFRRAGGDKAKHAQLLSVQRELDYDFPALGGTRVTLAAETPGERRRACAKGRAHEAEAGGDPQRKDGRATGVSLWEASFVLGEWLSRQKGGLLGLSNLVPQCATLRGWRSWKSRIGVELGAGLGLPSIVAGHLGAQMVATDGDAAVMRLLRENVVKNAPAGAADRVRAETLLWGTEDPLGVLGLRQQPEVILASDVVYASTSMDLTASLVATLEALTGPNTVIIMSNVLRFPEGHPQGEGRFFEALGSSFESFVLPQHELHADFQRVGAGSCSVRVLWRSQVGRELAPESRSAPRAKKRKADRSSGQAGSSAAPRVPDEPSVGPPRKRPRAGARRAAEGAPGQPVERAGSAAALALAAGSPAVPAEATAASKKQEKRKLRKKAVAAKREKHEEKRRQKREAQKRLRKSVPSPPPAAAAPASGAAAPSSLASGPSKKKRRAAKVEQVKAPSAPTPQVPNAAKPAGNPGKKQRKKLAAMARQSGAA